MKSNSSKFNFVSIFKYLMIIPVVMALAAMIIGLIAGFNYDYDYKNVTSFTVKFNTTVSEKEYKTLESEIKDVVVRYDFDSYRMERIGEDAQNGVIIKIVNEDNKYDEDITSLKTELEENLYSLVEDSFDRELYISTTDLLTSLPANSSRLVWLSVLAISCVMVLVFFYMWIRYNLMAGTTTILGILLALVMQTSALIIFRIPLNRGFILSYGISTMLGVVLSIIIHNALKPTINEDSYAKYSNVERVYSVVNTKFIYKVLIYLAFIILPLLIIAIFSTVSTLFTILSIIVSFVVSLFTTLIFAPSIWSFWYKRDKDKMLKRRKEREQKKLENKDKKDEKILV